MVDCGDPLALATGADVGAISLSASVTAAYGVDVPTLARISGFSLSCQVCVGGLLQTDPQERMNTARHLRTAYQSRNPAVCYTTCTTELNSEHRSVERAQSRRKEKQGRRRSKRGRGALIIRPVIHVDISLHTLLLTQSARISGPVKFAQFFRGGMTRFRAGSKRSKNQDNIKYKILVEGNLNRQFSWHFMRKLL